ncbi:MAG: L,D-transpeptidase family protein [Pseudomonadota bacterium]
MESFSSPILKLVAFGLSALLATAMIPAGAFAQQISPSIDLECEIDPACGLSARAPAQATVVATAASEKRVDVSARDARMFSQLTGELILAAAERGFANDGETTASERTAAQQFYLDRGPAPIFFDGDRLNDLGEAILQVFRTAEDYGLHAEDFQHPAFIQIGQSAGNAEIAGRADITMTLWAMRYARHAQTGRVNPASISNDIDQSRNFVDPASVLDRLLSATDPAKALTDYHPQHAQFEALREQLRELREKSDDEHLEPIAEGGTLRFGDRDARVPQLRQRLGVPLPATVPGDELSVSQEAQLVLASSTDRAGEFDAPVPVDPTLFDETLDEAVRAFQTDHNLVADGIVGPATFAALNEKAGDLVPHIVANMERWRWMPRDLGEFHVIANIPEFRLWVRRGDQTVFTTRTVVGTNKNRTVVFSDEMEYLAVNPYWNVPSSIMRKELLPRIVQNPGYLAARNYEALYNGRAIDPYAVNWQAISEGAPGPRIRQRPGPGNALGQIKFMFPNRHAIYFHDTPSRSLFGRDRRSFSHGCVRVQDPWAFAEALMTNEPGWDLAKLKSLRGPRERNKVLENRIPVHLTYFTARVDDDGRLIMARDLYGHHAKTMSALGLNQS